MAYQATVVPVMIASPGDVADEREIVRSVLHDWNDVNAAHSKVVLVPVGWDSHSSPELAGRPQEIINSRLLEPCDLLIGVFWTRIGTPTGKAQSGTVEEIERHVTGGKPAMLYFSSRPVAPESIDSVQYSALTKFRDEWCRPRGLVESFDSAEQFKAKFAKQLQITLLHSQYLRDIIVGAVSQQDEVSPEARASKDDVLDLSSQLSTESTRLLCAAAKVHGEIFKRAVIGSRSIQSGGEMFGRDSARDYARWEAALEQLIAFHLVTPRGYQDTIFELTHLGWQFVETLQQGAAADDRYRSGDRG